MNINKWILGTGSVLIVSAILFKVNHCVVVTGTSMNPTYHNLQIVSYNPNGQIVKNCVVVFKRNNETLIKRVTRVPGEYSDITILPYGKVIFNYLHDNEYFVEGDNVNSEDSWVYGMVTKKQILGVIYNVPLPSTCYKNYFALHK